MAKKLSKKTKVDAITHLLNLIEGFNQMIENHRSFGDELTVKQYEHMKSKLAADLFEMLKTAYHINIPQRQAA